MFFNLTDCSMSAHGLDTPAEALVCSCFGFPCRRRKAGRRFGYPAPEINLVAGSDVRERYPREPRSALPSALRFPC